MDAMQYLALERGWDTYDAEPPTALACENANKEMYRMSFWGWPVLRCKPSVTGGIGITYQKDKKTFYLECRNGGAICEIEMTNADVLQ